MANERKVKIVIETDGSKEAQESIRRLEADLTKFQKTGSRDDYIASVVKFKTELRAISAELKGASLTQADYNRYLSALSPAMQKAVADANKLGRGIKEIGTETQKAETSAYKFGTSIGSFIGNVGANAFGQFISYAGQGTQALIKYNLELEVSQQRFGQLIGTAQKGKEVLETTRNFALQYGQDKTFISAAVRDFQLLDLNARQSLPIIKAVGDMVAGVGGSDENKAQVAGVFQNILKDGRLTLDAVNQLESAGISQQKTFEILRQQTGKSNQEIAVLLQNGKIAAGEFTKAFVKFSQLKFGDAMKKESETTASAIKTITDALLEFGAARTKTISDDTGLTGLIKSAARLARDEAADIEFSKIPDEGVIEKEREEARQKAREKFRAEEFLRQRELEKSNLQLLYQNRFDVISTGLKVEEAKLNSHLRLTAQDELNYIVANKNLKQRAIQEQITQQTQFYNRQIALANGDAKEIAKLSADKNKTLRGLRADYQINELNTQRQIADQERRILEQRRQSTIQFYQLQARNINQVFSAQTFSLNRNISFGNNVQASFEQLKDLTQKNYTDISAITRQNYAIQLADERLTKEQRVNLNKQMFIDLQDLAIQNAQKQIEISDNQYREQVNRIQRYADDTEQIYQNSANIINGLVSFANPENFTANNAITLYDALFGDLKKKQAEIDKFQQIRSKIIDSQPKNPYGDVIAITDPNATAALATLDKQIGDLTDQYKKLRAAIADNVVTFSDFLADISNGKGKIEDFDTATKLALDSQHRLEKASLASRIDTAKTLLELANKANDERGAIELGGKNKDGTGGLIAQLTSQQTQLNLKQSAESLDLYKKSLEGLNDELNLLRNKDASSILAIQNLTKKEILNEQKSTLIEIEKIQYRLNNTPLIDQDKVHLAYLQKIVELRQREEASVISINNSLAEIAEKNKYSQAQSDAIYYAGIEQRLVSINESTANLKLGIVDGFLAPIDETFAKIDERLKKLPTGVREVVGAFSNFFKDIVKNQTVSFATNIVDAIFPGMGSQMEKAKNPVVGELKDHTRLLQQIATNTSGKLGGVGSASGAGGIGASGGIGGFISQILGGNGQTLFGGVGPNGSRTGDIANGMMQVFAGDKGRDNILSNLKYFFSKKDGALLGKGGIFGKDGFGFNSGTMGGIGGIASMVGGLIGGGVGGILSSAGMGMQLGSMFGAPGAIIGAAAGAIIGIFGIFSQRKKDRKTQSQSMTDTLKGLNDILTGLRANPPRGADSAESDTKKIQADYYSMANSLKSNKVKKFAIEEGHKQVDPLVSTILAEIPIAKQKAKNIEDRRGRLVAEFASGTYMSADFMSQYQQFKRRNGMLAGTYRGIDTMPSMLAPGEMVLNPMQIARVKAVSGFDPFKYARIPNYAEGGLIKGNSDTPTIGLPKVGEPKIDFHFDGNIVLEGFTASPNAKAWLQSPDGKREVIKIVKEGKAKKDLR